MSRAAILVLGMHRSGTSSAAWLCGRLGAVLPADGIDPHADNQRGYFESAALVRADDQLLRVCRSSWFDPRPLDWSRLPPGGLARRKARMREAVEAAWGDAPLLAVKDPRQCRFVPVIAEVLTDMGIQPRALLVLRPAAEIARSLAARDGTSPAFAHLLWLRHMIDAERATRAMPRAIVTFDTLLTDWRTALARIAPLAGRHGWTPDEAEAAAIDAFLDPGLRHHHAPEPPELWEPLAAIVAAVSTGLLALADRDDADARGALDTAYDLLDQAPWLEGEITHDELRHRRMTASNPSPFVPSIVEGRAPQHSAGGTSLDDARDERGEILAGSPRPTSLQRHPREGGDPAPAVELGPCLRGDNEADDVNAAPAPNPTPDADLIRNSGLFDPDWYRATYPDAAATGLDPIDHYLQVGAALGHRPNPLFDTAYYARQMARRDQSTPRHSREGGNPVATVAPDSRLRGNDEQSDEAGPPTTPTGHADRIDQARP